MSKVSRAGVPVAGVAVSIVILLIGSCLNYIILIRSACLFTSTAPACCRAWCRGLLSSSASCVFAMRIKAIASHPFRSILFPYANYLTMAFLICVLIGMYFNEDTRMSLFVGLIFWRQ